MGQRLSEELLKLLRGEMDRDIGTGIHHIVPGVCHNPGGIPQSTVYIQDNTVWFHICMILLNVKIECGRNRFI